MTKTVLSRFVLVLLVACLFALGMAAFKAYTILYNHILERSEAWHLRVEEVSRTFPLQLRITTDTIQSAPVIRSVTVKRHGSEMTVLYHLAVAGLAKPALNWGEAYVLIVPDSVSEVRFGRRSEIIWRRSNPRK